MKKNYLIVIESLLLLTIIGLLLTDKVYFIDNVYNWIVVHNSFLTKVLKIVTNLGSLFGILFLCILLFIFYKEKKDLLYLYGAIVLSTILNNILKIIFRRPRPMLPHLVEENSFSFPSGHASAVMTFYGYLIYMIWQSTLQKKLKIIFSIFLTIIILMVGYSRVYLNVHYVSDVLSGFMLSLIFLDIFIKLKEKKA